MSHYATLGVKSTATDQEIREAYRKLVKQHHPDLVATSAKAAAEEKFKQITKAYEVLKDPQSRMTYDSDLAGYDRYGRGSGLQYPTYSYRPNHNFESDYEASEFFRRTRAGYGGGETPPPWMGRYGYSARSYYFRLAMVWAVPIAFIGYQAWKEKEKLQNGPQPVPAFNTSSIPTETARFVPAHIRDPFAARYIEHLPSVQVNVVPPPWQPRASVRRKLAQLAEKERAEKAAATTAAANAKKSSSMPPSSSSSSSSTSPLFTTTTSSSIPSSSSPSSSSSKASPPSSSTSSMIASNPHFRPRVPAVSTSESSSSSSSSAFSSSSSPSSLSASSSPRSSSSSSSSSPTSSSSSSSSKDLQKSEVDRVRAVSQPPDVHG